MPVYKRHHVCNAVSMPLTATCDGSCEDVLTYVLTYVSRLKEVLQVTKDRHPKLSKP